MLRSFLAYTRGAGVNVRWMVMTGTPEFFRITKRIHNLVHGSPGDGGPLGDAERSVFEQVCEANAEHVASLVRPDDIVLLHDPQTAAMVPRMKATGAHVSGGATSAPSSRAIWSRPPGASSRILSRPMPASSRGTPTSPEWANAMRTEIIQPSIDVFSPKNQDLDPPTVRINR